MSVLSLQRLTEWAGNRKFEEGRHLFLKGAVLSLEYEPPLVRGEVSYGARRLRTAFRLLDDGSVESRCPCYDNLERGIVCAHVVALGLELQRRLNDPERLARAEEERRRAERAARFHESDYLRRGPAGPDTVPATLILSLLPNWTGIGRGGRAGVGCAMKSNSICCPIGEAPKTHTFAFSPADEALLFVLEDIADGPCPSHVEAGPQDFVNILRLMEGRAFVVGGGEFVPVHADRVETHLRASLDTSNGEIVLSLETPALGRNGADRLYLLDRRGGYLFANGAFRPLAAVLPEPLRDVYRGPVRIPRPGVPRFLRVEVPALSRLLPVICDIGPEMLTIVPERRSRIPGSTACVVRMEPRTCVSMSCCTASSSPSSTAAR